MGRTFILRWPISANSPESRLFCSDLPAGRIPSDGRLRIGAALHIERDFIQAGLGLVFHAGRTASVAIELNRAQGVGHLCRRATIKGTTTSALAAHTLEKPFGKEPATIPAAAKQQPSRKLMPD
jgi:hypothetical protein